MTNPAPARPPRLRFAPSPTGSLHVGGARTALFNWLYVRHYGGQFLLRIEDTDRARSTDESTRAIFDGLGWLGLGWDEEVVYQGANLERHRADADRLLGTGAAYRCFCTAAELAERRAEAEARGGAYMYDRRCDRLPPDEVARRAAAGEPHALRFRVPDGETAWPDLVHGRVAFPNKDVDDFVILRSDRTPIYNLAVVSDDLASGVTLVMRGDDHIPNTPKQILLYEALGAEPPGFAHLPMIHGTDGRKLSKRHGATAVGDYRHLGVLPEAMLNFLALLGWSPGGDREVMTVDEMVALFTTDALLKKAAVFDPQKLDWMNGQHLARMPLDALAALAAPAIEAAGLADAAELLGARRAWFDLLIEQLRVRSRSVDDIARQAATYLRDAVVYDDDAVAKHWRKDPAQAAALLAAARRALAALAGVDRRRDGARAAGRRRGERGRRRQALPPLRVALTGSAPRRDVRRASCSRTRASSRASTRRWHARGAG
jgi:glutamyl-tRNA synthetase